MKDGKADRPDCARDAAIDWWLRQNDRPLSKKEQADFMAWLASDEANKAAFEKIARISGYIAARPGAKTRPKARRSMRKPAAALIGAAALFIFFDDFSVYIQSDYSTGTGQTKRLTLADGSHVEIDAKSAIGIHYSAGQRRVTLLAGEAWFEVAPDPARPFVVEASGGTITALGTSFDIAVKKAWAHVVVTQHRVSVASGGGSVIVEEGQQSAYSTSASAQPPEPANIDFATAWRRGKLIFRNKPLAEVVEALGRYHRGYVYIVNSALRARPVTGVFRADDPLAALDEIETSLGVHATYFSNYLIFLHE